jgi:hypothetical protein
MSRRSTRSAGTSTRRPRSASQPAEDERALDVSHLGLVNAALRIDLGLRLRDEGSARAPHLVGNIVRRA